MSDVVYGRSTVYAVRHGVKHAVAALNGYRAELAEMRKQRDELLAALKAREWVNVARTWTEPSQYECPWCYQNKREGHAPDCQCGAAIASVKGE